jgi:large subunit ribosomal protein L13
MTVDKTYVPKGQSERNWVLVDANGKNLGRLATQIAKMLMGKNKPTYTPGVDGGDFVIVVNAGRIAVTAKRADEKIYHSHSGYPGGLRSTRMRDQLQIHPERVIRAAVWGMLPHNKLGQRLLKKLKIYSESEHPHQAQNPTTVGV